MKAELCSSRRDILIKMKRTRACCRTRKTRVSKLRNSSACPRFRPTPRPTGSQPSATTRGRRFWRTKSTRRRAAWLASRRWAGTGPTPRSRSINWTRTRPTSSRLSPTSTRKLGPRRSICDLYVLFYFSIYHEIVLTWFRKERAERKKLWRIFWREWLITISGSSSSFTSY